MMHLLLLPSSLTALISVPLAYSESSYPPLQQNQQCANSPIVLSQSWEWMMGPSPDRHRFSQLHTHAHTHTDIISPHSPQYPVPAAFPAHWQLTGRAECQSFSIAANKNHFDSWCSWTCIRELLKRFTLSRYEEGGRGEEGLHMDLVRLHRMKGCWVHSLAAGSITMASAKTR